MCVFMFLKVNHISLTCLEMDGLAESYWMYRSNIMYKHSFVLRINFNYFVDSLNFYIAQL